MSLLTEIKKDRDELKVPERNCSMGHAANKTQRNKEIMRRVWSGEFQRVVAEDNGISTKAVNNLVKAVRAKLKKYHLTKKQYLDN